MYQLFNFHSIIYCGIMTLDKFIHSAVYLTTGAYPIPKPVLHTVRSSASSFNFRYPLFFLTL